MGVYVKGMKMPESCLGCKLKYEFEGLGIWFCSCLSYENSDTDVSRNGKPLDLRPEWCPLVEVPEPHGRLIDENDVIELLSKGWKLSVYPNATNVHGLKGVIEAEGE